ncbi:glucosidase II beta subunit-like-domain-containing protein [Dissophora ornata]|nr:glucosidase II beta subunit-like-domain-containing protein [Dissophora ornata]
MKTHTWSITILVAVALSLVQANTLDGKGPRGVAPSRTKLYTPDSAGNWRCLDGSKTIAYAAINDDYCDCPDGSDEPGTPACGNAYYYCQNVGHTPAYIKTSRLNDGVCDSECCDGTDEFDGTVHCPDNCEKVGVEARKERERMRKVWQEGGKIKQDYIAYGKAARKRLRGQLEALQAKADLTKQKTFDAKDKLDSLNAKLQEYLESTKAEREAARELQLAPLIEQQNEILVRAIEAKDLLRNTLKELKENQNKNYHDMAVKAAITGFDEYLEELAQEAADEAEKEIKDVNEELSAKKRFMALQTQAYDARKEVGRMFQLLKAIKEGYNIEYNDEAVLKAIKVLEEFAPSWQGDENEFVGEEVIEIPEETTPTLEAPVEANKGPLSVVYERIQKAAKSLGLGPLFREEKTEINLAQDTYNKASDEERKLENDVQEIERKLATDYGKDDCFAQLVDQCFEYKDIEYTYSVCLFGSATQKAQSETSLGKFSSWEGDKYDTQMYTGGARCWNGPERSVKLVMTCGAVNEIVAVSEPNKCEYLFKLRTPAACRVLSELDTPQNDDIIPEARLPDSAVTEDRNRKNRDEL